MTVRTKFWKGFWVISFYLCTITGVLGVTSVLLDKFMFKEGMFTVPQILQFVALLVLAFFIRGLIYPRFTTPSSKFKDQNTTEDHSL